MARAAACADARDAAVAARDTAATLAAEAEALEPGGAPPTSGQPESWAAARDRAEQALALDAQDARAAAVVRAAQEEEATVPVRAASAWDGLVEAVSPWVRRCSRSSSASSCSSSWRGSSSCP